MNNKKKHILIWIITIMFFTVFQLAISKDRKNGDEKKSKPSGKIQNLNGEYLPELFRLDVINTTALSEETYTSEQEYLFGIFKSRRSIRKFKSDPIPDYHISKIIEIACTAPSSGNQQPWKFLIIKDRAKLRKLNEACADYYTENDKKKGATDTAKLNDSRKRRIENYSNYLNAPVFIIVLTDKKSKYPTYNIYDGTLAAGYLLIAARALGYGSVYTTDSFPYEIVKKCFEIPDNYEIATCTPVGIPELWPDQPKKLNPRELIHFEKISTEK